MAPGEDLPACTNKQALSKLLRKKKMLNLQWCYFLIVGAICTSEILTSYLEKKGQYRYNVEISLTKTFWGKLIYTCCNT